MNLFILLSTVCFFNGSNGLITSMPMSEGMVKTINQKCAVVATISTAPVVAKEGETLYKVIPYHAGDSNEMVAKDFEKLLDEIENRLKKLEEKEERNRRSRGGNPLIQIDPHMPIISPSDPGLFPQYDHHITTEMKIPRAE